MTIVFNIDKSIKERMMLEKRSLMFGSIVCILFWLATIDLIVALWGLKIDFWNLFILLFFVLISLRCYKWFKREFMYLEYKIENKKNSEDIHRERIRLKFIVRGLD